MTDETNFEDLVNLALDTTVNDEPVVYRFEHQSASYVHRDGIVDELFAKAMIEPHQYDDLMSYLAANSAKHGFGKLFEFFPPTIPYDKKGWYYSVITLPTTKRIHELVDAGHIGELSKHRSQPLDIVRVDSALHYIWQQMGDQTYITDADPAILDFVRKTMVARLIDEHGWETNDLLGVMSTEPIRVLERQMSINREQVAEMERRFNGNVFGAYDFYQIVSRSAYGTLYYIDVNDYSDEFHAYVEEVADRFGYAETDGRYKPKPIELPDNIEQLGYDLLSHGALVQVNLHGYQVIPFNDLRVWLLNHKICLTEYQIIDQLLGRQGAWREPLVVNGFRLAENYFYNQDFPDYDSPDHRFAGVAKFRQLSSAQDRDNQVCFAIGFPVHGEQVAIDPGTNTLVFLNMVGPHNSIQANWAALMQDRAQQWQGVNFKVGTARNHIRLRSKLPSGLVQMMLIHKEATPAHLNPSSISGYILAGSTDDVPEHFIATLDKLVSIPVLPEWSTYLWTIGRITGLIDYAGNPNKHINVTAWKIRTGADNIAWHDIISTAIQSKRISI